MEETVIQVNGLCKAYGGRTVLRDLSLSVERGAVFGLLGANGAGKTTAIECMLGTRKPDRGTVSILGLDPRARRKQLFQQVGVQFQESSYQREVRVGELCRETASLYRRPADWESLLAEFGLEGREKSLVKDLSGGQRQRLFVILALLPSPSAVFLDELTTGLDVKARRTVWRVLEERKRKGLTILLTSHFMDEVETLCDTVCILREGADVFQGTVEQAVAQSPCASLEDAYLWYSGEEVQRDESL